MLSEFKEHGANITVIIGCMELKKIKLIKSQKDPPQDDENGSEVNPMGPLKHLFSHYFANEASQLLQANRTKDQKE